MHWLLGEDRECNIEEYEEMVEGYRIQMYPDALGSPLNTSTATLVDEGEGKGENENDVHMENGTNDNKNGDSDEDSPPLAKRAK